MTALEDTTYFISSAGSCQRAIAFCFAARQRTPRATCSVITCTCLHVCTPTALRCPNSIAPCSKCVCTTCFPWRGLPSVRYSRRYTRLGCSCNMLYNRCAPALTRQLPCCTAALSLQREKTSSLTIRRAPWRLSPLYSPSTAVRDGCAMDVVDVRECTPLVCVCV